VWATLEEQHVIDTLETTPALWLSAPSLEEHSWTDRETLTVQLVTVHLVTAGHMCN